MIDNLNINAPVPLLEFSISITSRVIIDSFFSENFEGVQLNGKQIVTELLGLIIEGRRLLGQKAFMLKLMFLN
jgi:hypothetical protein